MDPQSRTSPTPPASCDCKHWRIFSSESKAEVSDLPPIGEHGSDLEDAIIIDCPSKHDVSMPMESKHSRQPEAISEPERSDMFNRADTHFAKELGSRKTFPRRRPRQDIIDEGPFQTPRLAYRGQDDIRWLKREIMSIKWNLQTMAAEAGEDRERIMTALALLQMDKDQGEDDDKDDDEDAVSVNL